MDRFQKLATGARPMARGGGRRLRAIRSMTVQYTRPDAASTSKSRPTTQFYKVFQTLSMQGNLVPRMNYYFTASFQRGGIE